MSKISFIFRQPAFWVGLICLSIIFFDLVSWPVSLNLQASLYQISLDFLNQREFDISDLKLSAISLEESFLETDAVIDSLINSLQELKTQEESSSRILEASDFYKRVFGEGLAFVDLNKLAEELRKERRKEKTDFSIFKEFVTPNDPVIIQLANKSPTIEILYLNSQKNWVWRSDSKLWRKEEKWLLPREFLTIAPRYKGKPQGDCEDQANAFASLLRASGISPENVRLALGIVRLVGIEEESAISFPGGHVWVEFYKDGKWLILDPSNGPLIDEKGNFYDIEPLPFDFFESHVYLARKVLAYYNDQYFYDVSEEPKNIPALWQYYNFKEE